MNTATVCVYIPVYVYQVILDVNVILLCEYSVLDKMELLNIIFCLQKSQQHSPAKDVMRTCDWSLTTFTKHLFSL